ASRAPSARGGGRLGQPDGGAPSVRSGGARFAAPDGGAPAARSGGVNPGGGAPPPARRRRPRRGVSAAGGVRPGSADPAGARPAVRVRLLGSDARRLGCRRPPAARLRPAGAGPAGVRPGRLSSPRGPLAAGGRARVRRVPRGRRVQLVRAHPDPGPRPGGGNRRAAGRGVRRHRPLPGRPADDVDADWMPIEDIYRLVPRAVGTGGSPEFQTEWSRRRRLAVSRGPGLEAVDIGFSPGFMAGFSPGLTGQFSPGLTGGHGPGLMAGFRPISTAGFSPNPAAGVSPASTAGGKML